jgi:hypothetical protein
VATCSCVIVVRCTSMRSFSSLEREEGSLLMRCVGFVE